jgi:cytochrome c oxidase cbb3-type subunit 3
MRRIINEGVPAKGMVSWKTLLNPEKIENVIAFLQTLEGTNPPNAKAPQGKEYPE